MSDNLVTICTLTNQAEADLVESILRAADIDIVHDHEYATTSGIANTAGIHIAVREHDVARAKEVLDTSDFEMPSEE